MASPRWEDWEIAYLNKNQFHFLGNGVTHREVTGTNLAFYLREQDGEESTVEPSHWAFVRPARFRGKRC